MLLMKSTADFSLKCALISWLLQVFPVILKNLGQSAVIRLNTV